MYKFHLYIYIYIYKCSILRPPSNKRPPCNVYIYIYINARFYGHPQISAHLAIGFFSNKPLSGINAHGQLFEHII